MTSNTKLGVQIAGLTSSVSELQDMMAAMIGAQTDTKARVEVIACSQAAIDIAVKSLVVAEQEALTARGEDRMDMKRMQEAIKSLQTSYSCSDRSTGSGSTRAASVGAKKRSMKEMEAPARRSFIGSYSMPQPASWAQGPKQHGNRKIHLAKFPCLILSRTLRQIAQSMMDDLFLDGESVNIGDFKCRNSDDSVAITVDTEEIAKTLVANAAARLGIEFIDEDGESSKLKLKHDAPYHVRHRQRVLSLLWKAVEGRFCQHQNLSVDAFSATLQIELKRRAILL